MSISHNIPGSSSLRLVKRVALIVLLTFAVTAPAAYGQAAPESAAGRRVRVTLVPQDAAIEGNTTPQVLRGLAVSVARDSILLRIHPAVAPSAVAVSGISQLELSQGVDRLSTSLNRGLRAILPATGLSAVAKSAFDLNTVEAWLVTGSAGFLLGAALGALFPEEQWTTIFLR